MPTIARFLSILVVLAILVGAAMYYLGNFVTPQQRPMTVRIPATELEPVPAANAPSAEVEPVVETSLGAELPEQ